MIPVSGAMARSGPPDTSRAWPSRRRGAGLCRHAAPPRGRAQPRWCGRRATANRGTPGGAPTLRSCTCCSSPTPTSPNAPSNCQTHCSRNSRTPTSCCTPATGSTRPPSTCWRAAAAGSSACTATTTAPTCGPGCPRWPTPNWAACVSRWSTRRAAAQGREARCAARFPDADVLVFGHSHIPWDSTATGGLRLLNPGSPTDRRRQPHCTYMTATVTDGGRLADVALHRLPPRTPLSKS